MQDQTISDKSLYAVKFCVTDEVRLVLMNGAWPASNKVVLRKFVKTTERIGNGVERTIWRTPAYASHQHSTWAPLPAFFDDDDAIYDSIDEFSLDAAIKNLHSMTDGQLWTLKFDRYTYCHVLTECEFQSKFYSWPWEQAIEMLNDSTAKQHEQQGTI